jgi:predicted dehydrogenase
MSKIVFGIVGGGWRADFYLRITKALPELFEICGIVVRDGGKGKLLEEKWGIRTYRNIDQLLKANSPSFMVVSVRWPDAPVITGELVNRGIPVLSETPPAPDLEALIQLNKLTDKGGKIQVAEQYHLQPLHAARLAIASSGKLGDISQVQISVCHWYHAISLMRKFMGLKFENALISAHNFVSPLVDGPGRDGLGQEEKIVQSSQVIAMLDFGHKLGVYDFTNDQYFSWIRSLRLMVRGERGEITDNSIKYLKDHRTPVEIELRRINAGENGNLEGYYLKGILAGEDWVYTNPFIPGRLTDDEIAIAACLEKMDRYVKGGPEFYSLAEASQDHYIALMIDRAVKNKERVRTETQPWAY